jgi:hypothetical protein
MRRAIYALLFLCLGLQCILGYKVWQRFQVEALNVTPPQLNFRAARQIFPFSVIPGGVLDERELADSMAKDEVVRKHYSGLQPDRMWFSRTKQPMVAYVSYRKGSNVCWTSHPVTIPANELVLTDGKHMVRARCGNRIEVKKPEPLPAMVVPPDIPPPDIALDTGLPSLIPPTVVPPVLPPTSELAKAGGGPPLSPRISTPPTTWCCGLTSTTTTTNNVPTVPEPPSFFLVLAGVLCVVAVVAGKRFL